MLPAISNHLMHHTTVTAKELLKTVEHSGEMVQRFALRTLSPEGLFTGHADSWMFTQDSAIIEQRLTGKTYPAIGRKSPIYAATLFVQKQVPGLSSKVFASRQGQISATRILPQS